MIYRNLNTHAFALSVAIQLALFYGSHKSQYTKE